MTSAKPAFGERGVEAVRRGSRRISALVMLGLWIASAVWLAGSGPRPAVSLTGHERRTVSTATSSTTTPAAPPTPSPFLTRAGRVLMLDGKPYRSVGVNSYSMATDWGNNLGCGERVDADALFARLPTRALVRMWAWQGAMATHPETHTRNWAPLDHVVAAAERHGVLLIMSLTSQGGECDDGHWKDRSWYGGGFRHQRNQNGYTVTTTSYWNYVREIVARYADSPAIGMWEPVNEPESSDCDPGYSTYNCYGHLRCNRTAAAAALRYFFDVIGGEIKRIDRNHLVESGVVGSGQCGAISEDYSSLHASPGIDVASYHDYGAPDNPMPGDRWNGLAVRLDQSRSLAKPLIVGESGIPAIDGASNCPSRAKRVRQFRNKLDGMFARGVSAFLTWNASANSTGNSCTFNIGFDDPAFAMLRSYRVPQA